MARTTQIVLEDDLTGELLDDGAGETISFALDGTSYEIDLSTANAAELREKLGRYTAAGRKVTSTRRSAAGTTTRRPAGGRSDLAQVREWAKANGHEVSERGRIKSTVIEAFDAAH